MKNNTSSHFRLRAALDHLYEVFAVYETVDLAPSEPLCPADMRSMNETREQLVRKVFAELTAFDLLDYYYLAIDHIGSVDDLRHFLPKLLEHMAMSPKLLEPAYLVTLLRAARFTDWPLREQEAVVEYIVAAAADGMLPHNVASEVQAMAHGQ